jgi:hypothetical protein
LSNATAVSLEIFDKNMQEKQIFAPGSSIVFKADTAEDADSAMLIIKQSDNPIETFRMKLLSESPKQFAYLYQIPANITQGDYVAKVISKGETAEEEFYIGIEVKGQLMDEKQVEFAKAGWLEKLWLYIKNMLGIE